MATAAPSLPSGAWRSLTWWQPAGDIGTPERVAAGWMGIVALQRAPAVAACRSDLSYSPSGGVALQRADTSDATFRCARIDQVIATNNGFLAEGVRDADTSVHPTTIWTSIDGSVWKPVATAAFDGGTITAVAHVGDGVVAVGSNGRGAAIWLSPDGSSWVTVQPGEGFEGATLTSVGGNDRLGFIVAGSVAGTAGAGPRPTVWLSADARSWTPVTLPGGANAPVDSIYIGAAGVRAQSIDPATRPPEGGWAWQSTDGKTWTAATFMDGILASDGTRILHGVGQRVEQSADASSWYPIDVADHGPIFLEALGPAGVVVMSGDSGQLWFLDAISVDTGG